MKLAPPALKPVERPEGYAPPTWKEVEQILVTLKKQRQPVIERIWEIKRARRDEWDELMKFIPSAYRKMLMPHMGMPQLRDMVLRVAGLIKKQEPEFMVIPPSPRPPEVNKASKEEMRLHALRLQIADQQDRDPYGMAIDAQVAWGESWLSVWPDPRRFDSPEYKRGKDEDPKEYKERYNKLMADGGVPIVITDHDPQTVFPFRSDRERLAVCITESEHMAMEIELGFGYHPVKGEDGKTAEWIKRSHTLSEPFVALDSRGGSASNPRTVDHNHDRGDIDSSSKVEGSVRKVIFMDCWTYQCYLDGILVEEWQHDWGVVPMFPAEGEETSDRDPAWRSHGIVDPALGIAKQVLLYSAVLASNAMQHGFPTPFLKNPDHGLVHPVTGEPLSRAIKLGEINFLGSNEDIQFPFLQAQMMPDFFRYMDQLNGAMEKTTLADFGKALGSDMAGYAIAQIRSMQMSILVPIYKSATRQWRKIAYLLRHIIKNVFPGGIALRGAVEEDESGAQYRPILEYSKDHCTDFAIEVRIDEGIQQDEIAMGKYAAEMGMAGYWSRRRVMEKIGVEDPAAEAQEISLDRVLSSAAADQVVLQMAMEIAAERLEATRQDQSSPFYQALAKAKGEVTGTGEPQPAGGEAMGGAGQFQNQGSAPMNADAAGTPMGGQGAPEGIDLQGMGLPTTPGGVPGQSQVPVGSPG